MTEQVNDWRELREFAGVDLLQSFVLSWEHSVGVLTIDVDVCLLPDHPFFEEPRPAEGICIRPAKLEFPYCTSLWAAQADADRSDFPAIAAALGHGRIEGLQRVGDGRYEITGGFGRVAITSERPLLRLKGPVT